MSDLTRRQICILALAAAGLATPAFGEARLSGVERGFLRGTALSLALDRRVPFRAFVLTDPPRLVIDVADPEIEAAPGLSDPAVRAYRAGRLGEGWSRLIVELSEPMVVGRAAIEDANRLEVRLKRASEAEMASAARLAPGPEVLRDLTPARPDAAPGTRPRIVIDPGHGGIDPGALRDGVIEKEVALAAGLKLAAALEETGRYEVLMTRRDDRFVLLGDRVRFARGADATLFLSLHTNTVTRGNASGATVYVSSSEATDSDAAAVARLENRSDADAGIPRADMLDDLAQTLIEIEGRATEERSRMAAKHMVSALDRHVDVIRTRPLRAADFRVLRAPDLPSTLIELGFLSDSGDRRRMVSEIWQRRFATALREAVDEWMTADAAFLALMRQ